MDDPVDNQDNMWRGVAVGPHAHGNAVRHMSRGVGSKSRKTTPATTSTIPVCQLLGSANTETARAKETLDACIRRALAVRQCEIDSGGG